MAENIGMYAHVVNIMVLILIPMVIIHINGHAFSLSMLIVIYHLMAVAVIHVCNSLISGRYVCLFPVFYPFYEIVELCPSEQLVSKWPEREWHTQSTQ